MPVPRYRTLLRRAGQWLPAAHYPLSRGEWSDRFMQAVLFSCIAHVAFFFGAGWKPANPSLFDKDIENLAAYFASLKPAP